MATLKSLALGKLNADFFFIQYEIKIKKQSMQDTKSQEMLEL